jgi:cytochrome P450
MSRYPNGPRDYFFGATLIQRFRRNPLKFSTEIGHTYGDLACFRLGPVRAYIVNNPRLIREVLVAKHKHFRRPKLITQPLAKIDGNGLVLSEGDFWQRQRRLIQPAFASRRFGPYARATVDYTLRMLDGWSNGASLNIADAMTRLTLQIIAKTLFGVELAGQAERLSEAVRVIAETFVAEAGNPVHLPDWLPLPAKRRKRWAIRTLDELVRGIIRQRRASGEDLGDLLSMLLLAVDEEGDGRGMTDEQARDEAMTLFNAGHDTTAAALAWTWSMVASHPAIEDRLIDEVDAVLGGHAPTLADVARLPYVEMVVKESLRLYPPTWSLLPREVVEPVEIGGYDIARGSWIYVFPYVTQRDPRFFENPEAFDPERFSPARSEEIPPYAYIPFGGGPRVCIGEKFSMMEMILIVATVLQKVRMKLAPEQGVIEPEPLIAIRPKGGLLVEINRRAELVSVGKNGD